MPLGVWVRLDGYYTASTGFWAAVLLGLVFVGGPRSPPPARGAESAVYGGSREPRQQSPATSARGRRITLADG